MTESHDASTADRSAYEIPAYRLGAYVPERQVDEMYGVGDLARLIGRKLRRRLAGDRDGASPERIAANYAGLVVLDRREQHMAGLALAQDFPRALNQLGVGPCERLFEFCSGPGYIGYALLAHGWCETLALADVDGESIATAQRTAALNGIERRVTAYVSDVLDGIPAHERWDLVVANPPAFSRHPERELAAGEWDRGYDPDWSVRRRFYASVKRHMRPGGVVVTVENSRGADPEAFARMIRDGGGAPRPPRPATDVRGRETGVSFQVSDW